MKIPYNNSLSAMAAVNLSAGGQNVENMFQNRMAEVRGGAGVSKAMIDATGQIASAVAQDMVDAVSQAAMKYTNSNSLQPSRNFNQRADIMADQIRNSILVGQPPTRRLLPMSF